MAYWLVKSEPGTYGWDSMVKDRRTKWDGVRNHQAANNLKAMKKDDEVLFYHSGDSTEVVGIVRVVKPYYPDPSDATGKFGMVDLEAVKPLSKPVPLAAIKADPSMRDFALVRQSRLSVVPVTADQWKSILKMGAAKA
jgi:predicted RNA-binding protein with PUA-like domain